MTETDEFLAAMRDVNHEESAAAAVGAVGAIIGQAAAAQRAIEGAELFELPPSRMFYSLGHVCELLQQPPSVVRQAMRDAGVRDAFAINDIVHLSGDAVLKLHHHLRGDR